MSAPPRLVLTAIERSGDVRGEFGAASGIVAEVARAMAELYERAGFEPPWIGYVAWLDGEAVGTCGFKSPPRDGRVEIAYFTFPPFEGRGVATLMAAELVALTRRRDENLSIAAQTLPERNASHRVLEKLGFRHVETLEHPEDGVVWEWRADATAVAT